MPTDKKSTVQLLHLHRNDNVAVLAQDAETGAFAQHGTASIPISVTLSMGHKIAIAPIAKGADVVKYGAPIGFAACNIDVGDHVHLHNLTSRYTAIEDMEASAR